MQGAQGLAELEAALAGLETRVVGQQLALFEALDSTNTWLTQQARQGVPEGLTVLVNEQLAGKGRRGRSWASPANSSVLCSVLLRPDWLPARQAFSLTLLAAVAAAEALEQAAGLAIELKWPNDLQHAGRKLGGILVEVEGAGDMLSWAVIGCGINVNWDPASLPELQERATSVQHALGRPVDRGLLARALIEQLDQRYGQLRRGAAEELHQDWRARLSTLGQQVRVEGPAGSLSGYALDVAADGALLVRDDQGAVHRLLSGEVSVRTSC